jgi:hypothetical protein
MLMLVIRTHNSNAKVPMLLTLPGIVTLVTFAYSNAQSPMEVTVIPSMLVGTVTTPPDPV